jgi:hypothetical protein
LQRNSTAAGAFNTLLPHLPLQKFKKCATAQTYSSDLCAADFMRRRKQVGRYLANLEKNAGYVFLTGMVRAVT